MAVQGPHTPAPLHIVKNRNRAGCFLTMGLAFLPALILMGLGMGLTFMPVFATATAGIAPQDSGATSATVNTSQQVGGSIGTALLNAIATTSSTAYATAGTARTLLAKQAVVHGYTAAIWCAAGIMLLAGLVAALMVTTRPPAQDAPAEGAMKESMA